MIRTEELNVLIVDDEVLETEYLLMLLPGTGYKFQSVQTAFNIMSAKEILQNTRVDLLLCDIEMPQGSGLDLLAWIRQEKMNVEALIITSHPEFDYAQKAMQLSSVDYLLKPVMADSLKTSLERALERIESTHSANQFEAGKGQMREAFFREMIEGRRDMTEAEMNARMRNLDVVYDCSERMLGLYFRMDRSLGNDSDASVWSDKTVLINMMEEILFEHREKPWIYFPENKAFFLAFPVKYAGGSFKSFYDGKVKHFLRVAESMLGIYLACFPGESVPFAFLGEVCDSLRVGSRKYFVLSGEVVLRKFAPEDSSALSQLHTGEWEMMLENGRADKIASEMEVCFGDLKQRRIVYTEEIYSIGGALDRAAEGSLKKHNREVSSVLTEEIRNGLYMRNSIFLEEFINAAGKLLASLAEIDRERNDSEQIIDRICSYIDMHIEEDLDRRDLAERFALSPDYLSRLFRAKKGITLVSYITKAKLAYCCRLFEMTDCSVNQAAAQTGYTNFSYFSKLFHDEYGCTPQQYKKKLSEKHQ